MIDPLPSCSHGGTPLAPPLTFHLGVVRGDVNCRPRASGAALGRSAVARRRVGCDLVHGLRSGDGLTIVRLYIDEPDAYPGSEDDLDIIWLPILSALAENLSNPPATEQAA